MKPISSLLLAATVMAAGAARADAVTDWNTRAGDFIAEAKMGTPPAVRLMAIVQTAVHDAVGDASARQPDAAARSVAIDAAVAAANRAVLVKALPAQEPAITNAYKATVAALPEGAARAAGIDAGEKAAQAVLAARADD
ncbi:MAG TPA: hypothetical protein VGE72_22590, partial [Azospirillum sp.]